MTINQVFTLLQWSVPLFAIQYQDVTSGQCCLDKDCAAVLNLVELLGWNQDEARPTLKNTYLQQERKVTE